MSRPLQFFMVFLLQLEGKDLLCFKCWRALDLIENGSVESIQQNLYLYSLRKVTKNDYRKRGMRLNVAYLCQQT